MNPIPFCALLCSCLLGLAFADEPPMKYEKIAMNCTPTNCGTLKNITYPFWVGGQQPPYCGFPSFRLNCTYGISILELDSECYQVKQIFYDNQSVVLANTKFYNNSICSVEYKSLPSSLPPFSVSPVNREIVFLFDCSKPQPNNYYKIRCADDTSVYLVNESDSSSSSCQTKYMPVLDPLDGDASDYLQHLETGFLANWTVASCKDCKESNGQCGYNKTTDTFMCICPERTHLNSCHPGKSNKNKRNIVIGASVGAAFLLACCFFLLWFRRRTRQQQHGLSNLLSRSFSSKTSFKRDAELGESNYHTHIFSYEELEAATDGFNESRELGDGGFGTVYKGKLRDGRTVAVKRLYEHNYRRLEQFMNEVEILSCLRHQNLVTLYGCTSRHSRELLLVYEYIPNGTVADHLHGPLASKGALPWSARMSIAIETADALAYLHNVERQIIHRDVKSNNILLDNNLNVKVADFGLSRLFPLDATHVSTAPQGTPGYVDPEYHQCYQLTDKSDVYSFGVVLVELISSKPAVDINRHRHEINLANLAVTKIQNCQLEQLVDLELGYMVDVEIKRMINQVAELAFRCLQLDREMRPSIKEVLEGLRGIEGKEVVEVNEVKAKEEARLVKTKLPCSPVTVTERWQSMSTTPNASA